MSQQIAVPLQNGEIVALVTYSFVRPYIIRYDHYCEEEKYSFFLNGESMKFANGDDLLAWLEVQRPQIAVPATISNVIFLKSEYQAEALKIYGSDLREIERELAKIPRLEYETAQALMDHCCPPDYY